MRTIRTSAEQAGAQAPAEGSDTFGRPQAGEERKKGRKGQNIAVHFHRARAMRAQENNFSLRSLTRASSSRAPGGAPQRAQIKILFLSMKKPVDLLHLSSQLIIERIRSWV